MKINLSIFIQIIYKLNITIDNDFRDRDCITAYKH